MKTVCVIGGGVVGLSTALALYEQGFSVVVIEAEKDLASGASAQNGAQLSYSYVDALGSSNLLMQLPKLALGLDPSFNIKLRPSLSRVRWLLDFLKNCTNVSFERNTLSLLALAELSREVLLSWRDEHTLDFDYRTAGKLLLCNAETLAKHDANRQIKGLFGIKQTVLDRTEVYALEPFLLGAKNSFSGGIYAPGDAVGDPKSFVHATADFLEHSGDVDFVLGERISKVNVAHGQIVSVQSNARTFEADAFVLCTAMGSVDLAANWGEHLPIQPMVGYSLDLATGAALPTVSITDTVSKTVICRLGDRVRFAGLADLGFEANAPREHRERYLREIFERLYGDVTGNPDTSAVWIGARPLTPDSRPIIRPATLKNAFFNCGHGMFGWTLAAGSGLVCARQVKETLR